MTSPASILKSASLVLALTLAGLTGCGGASPASSAAISTPAPTPAPSSDFTLDVSPSTITVASGAASSPVTIQASAIGGFTGTVAATLTGLPAGVTANPASLTLTPGTPQTVTFQSTAQSVVGSYVITLTGISGALSHTASLALTIASTASPASTGIDVTTYHYDNTRQGLNANETILTPSNVNSTSFGLVGNFPVDGKVDAQPLLISGVTTSAGATNILFVATEHDSVYALDAATGTQLWKTSILRTGETTSDDHNCSQITPQIGITSTPVVDRSHGVHGAIFVVGMSKDSSGKYHQRLHALDVTTGAELAGSPTEIQATFPGAGENSSNGQVIFDPAQYAERAGLLLLNGTIYTGWTSHCDQQPYTGWIMGYDETSLLQSTVLNLTPNGSEGSIWMSGYGLAADSAGDIYFLDANGSLDASFTAAGLPSRADYGNAMMKLSTASGLAVADFFEPYNTAAESDADVDLGSGGAMLLPDMTDTTGKTRHLVVGAGKDSNIYLADRDNMGKFNATGNTNLYQELPAALPNGAWSGPAFFNNTVFYAGVGDTLKAFPLNNALLAKTPSSKSAAIFPYPGATPAVSANGAQNGIVWALESSTAAPGVLHAYDASNLANELYNSNQAGARDAFGYGNKFITPMIANGRVYVGTPNSVAVFGLLQP